MSETIINAYAYPASIKLEKNSKGWNFEITYHGNSMEEVIEIIIKAKQRIEKELKSGNPDCRPV